MRGMDVRPTRAIVDLDAIAHNLAAVRLRRPGRPVCAVIKADGYGHGLVPVARVLEHAGVELFAVALVEEGTRLRDAGIRTPILVLGAALFGGYRLIVDYDLTPMIFTADHLRELSRAAQGASVSYHLKIDTGMSRLGLAPRELSAFLTRAKNEPTLRLDGVMTHFANADEKDAAMNQRQAAAFTAALREVRDAGFEPSWVHSANSAATESFDDGVSNALRPGFLLYGVSPLHPDPPDLRPALRWVTAPVHVKTIPAGTPVSYGGHWVSKRETRVATLPVGYADGYPRALSNRAEVLVRGRRAPVIGSVCMDLVMVDVTDIPGVAVGDEVVLLGRQGSEHIGAHELAERAGTIPYEIVTGVQKRVPRIYVGALANELAA